MDTMEITKIVGAVCGSLLVFLLIVFGSEIIFDTHSEMVAYVIDTGEAEAPADEPAEAVDVAALMAAADPEAGAAIFRRCAACHKVDGANAVGPHLDGVFGRDKGSVSDFGYSDTLTSLEGVWDADSLYHFVNNPRAFAPGTSMNFPGITRPDDLADLIAYLESVSN
jgi:cytochrome c